MIKIFKFNKLKYYIVLLDIKNDLYMLNIILNNIGKKYIYVLMNYSKKCSFTYHVIQIN